MASKNTRKPAAKNNAKKTVIKVAVKPAAKKAVAKVAPASRVRAEKAAVAAPPIKPAANRDPRLPAPGTVLTRVHKGREYKAKVLENGFLYEGRNYKSLSAIGKEITQTACNGFAFFHRALRKPADSALDVRS